MMKLPVGHFAAIDPMAVILPENVYYIWTLIHHPHVPAVADLEKIFERMTPEERTYAVERAKVLGEYGKALEEVAARNR